MYIKYHIAEKKLGHITRVGWRNLFIAKYGEWQAASFFFCEDAQMVRL